MITKHGRRFQRHETVEKLAMSKGKHCDVDVSPIISKAQGPGHPRSGRTQSGRRIWADNKTPGDTMRRMVNLQMSTARVSGWRSRPRFNKYSNVLKPDAIR